MKGWVGFRNFLLIPMIKMIELHASFICMEKWLGSHHVIVKSFLLSQEMPLSLCIANVKSDVKQPGAACLPWCNLDKQQHRGHGVGRREKKKHPCCVPTGTVGLWISTWQMRQSWVTPYNYVHYWSTARETLEHKASALRMLKDSVNAEKLGELM